MHSVAGNETHLIAIAAAAVIFPLGGLLREVQQIRPGDVMAVRHKSG